MPIPLRVLLVEDSEDDASLILFEITRGGFDVTHRRVDSGAAMIAALEAEAWDVVISDYSLPGFSGTEALRLLRTKSSEIPFIYISGTLNEDAAAEALKSGAQDYLVKGKLTRLVPTIQRELRDGEVRRERQRLEAQVHQLQRFEAIGRLAGGIAHDFNNAIGAILGWAEIGYQELPETNKTRERLARIKQQALRAAGLTHQLLAFARRQVLQRQNLDVNILVKDTVSLLEKIIGEHIQMELALASNLEPAWADATQIEQVITNLCLNARDAMPQGGRLRIQTEITQIATEAKMPTPYFRPGKYLLLTISDTGTGMNPETLEHIFEPFFTTKKAGKGTGLGLATVYGIVRQHDGIIDVKSAPGAGTEFRIYLPTGSGAAQGIAKKTEAPVERGAETILVAEDHDGLRVAAKEILESFGYHVLPAATGEKALQIFEARHNTIDLVVLDVVMPTMTGPQIFEKMMAIKPGLRAIFTTGYAIEDESLGTGETSEYSILLKPYSSKELAHKVRSVLSQGS